MVTFTSSHRFQIKDDRTYCFFSEDFQSVFPHIVKLTENVRQDEERFVKVISDIYQGDLTEHVKDFLKSVNKRLTNDTDSVKLFATNLLVDTYNRECLLNCNGDMYEFQAIDTGDSAELKHLTVPKTLWLKIGCPVILLRNLTDNLVNGLRGTLTHATDKELAVYFPSLQRTQSLQKEIFTVFDPRKNADIASRMQFPVKPAFALTIHKAQGMTLSWVEVDCRDIFKTGQLGVAISRVKSSAGLHVINFHPRCLFRPPAAIQHLMNMHSKDILDDMSCCRNRSIEPQQLSIPPPMKATAILSDTTSYEMELEDDFNDILASIESDEQDVLEFDIPGNFNIRTMLAEIRFTKEFGQSRPKCNLIISQLDPENPKLVTFVKKLFFKMSTVLKSLNIDVPEPGTPVPESVLGKFYKQTYEYTTGIQYTMDCLWLFNVGTEQVFEQEHKMVCYMIVEYIRQFLLEQRVQLIQSNVRKITKRFTTDASRSRIRYVAGYCVAKLRKKYLQLLQSNMFSNSKAAQTTFKEARYTLLILNSFKEEEHYLHQVTSDPDSLTDTERKQNVRRGLTNVTDDMFKFFLSLTDMCLAKLINENLTKYGKSMFNNCLEHLLGEKNLYQQFAHMVVKILTLEATEEFSSCQEHKDISELVDTLVITSAQICSIYNELVNNYFMVLFAQFCRDVKGDFHVTKTMAHRKQIKVSKCAEQSIQKKSATEKTDISSAPLAQSLTVEEQSILHYSAPDPQPGTSSMTSDLCKKCLTVEGDQWIQCDSCNEWYHRKCAGLQNARKWRKYSKDGTEWNCKDCE